MGLKIGDHLPAATFKVLTETGMKDIKTDFFNDKKVLIFAVPGAFTPTCNNNHLPGYLTNGRNLKAKGIDIIACVAVNDPFVMKAWASSCGVGNDILMLADGSGTFTKACGLELDLTAAGLGMRSRRYAMLVEKGIVKKLELDEGGTCDVSSAEKVLAIF